MRIVHNKRVKRYTVFFYPKFLKNVDKNKILVDNNCDYQKDEKVRFSKCKKVRQLRNLGGKNMYIFNRITVNPQLPKRIGRITENANNLWWAWNTEFLRLFKMIDIDLWENCNKNPVKFLKAVDQEKLEEASKDFDNTLQPFQKIIFCKNSSCK